MQTIQTLHARDVMQTRVITLPADASLSEAVRTFEDFKISGAPVVDGVGKLVGVVSASDITDSRHIDDGGLNTERTRYYMWAHLEEDDVDWFRDFEPREDVKETVRECMTARVISVDPETSLDAVCRVMRDEQVHRVLVTEEDAVLGIISSFDVVKAIANA